MKVLMDKCNTQFKPQIYQSKRRGQNRHKYTHNDYQTGNRSFSRDRNTYKGRGNFGRNFRQNYRGRPQDIFRNDYRRDHHREERYRNRSVSRDNYKDVYRDRENSREDYS